MGTVICLRERVLSRNETTVTHNSSNTRNEDVHDKFNCTTIYTVSGVMLNVLQILFHLIPRAISAESTMSREVR